MAKNSFKSDTVRPAGYAFLIRQFNMQALPHWHISEVGGSKHQKNVESDGRIRETFPNSYWPGDIQLNHLEFALKYDGINLEILSEVFSMVPVKELTLWITAKPQGQYTRRIWYLYEWMTGKPLKIDRLTSGNYIDLLDKDEYYTAQDQMISRQRIRDNLPGNAKFCPIIRRTEAIRTFETYDLSKKCRQILAGYSAELLKRAVSYLYTKETKSSFAIEHITPDAGRTERFAQLLQIAEKDDFVNKDSLVDLQNRIVDPRYANKGYRNDQNYVGETVAWQQEKIHFISPRPEDIEDLMKGLIRAHQRMDISQVHPVVHAAAIAFGFVFMHPFGDGNGRIHRFLIHNILARRSFTPSGLIFPISAAMLNNMAAYDASLESFSKPLISLVNYILDEDGRMKVHNRTAVHYRYPDMTAIAEALFGFIKTTIEKEMVEELNFLKNYDMTKRAIQEIVDMPDNRIDLFIRLSLQNNGVISPKKRKSHFAELTDEEVQKMQAALRKSYR
ncbi:MAG: Fic family protein [Sedimentisphaerales bacterium]|nr:Fic family protein [Sedimentisphaerales bacterium]